MKLGPSFFNTCATANTVTPISNSNSNRDPDNVPSWPDGSYLIERRECNYLTNQDYGIRIKVKDGDVTLLSESMQVALLMDIRGKLNQLADLLAARVLVATCLPDSEELSAELYDAVQYVLFGKRDFWEQLAEKVMECGGISPDEFLTAP